MITLAPHEREALRRFRLMAAQPTRDDLEELAWSLRRWLFAACLDDWTVLPDAPGLELRIRKHRIPLPPCTNLTHHD